MWLVCGDTITKCEPSREADMAVEFFAEIESAQAEARAAGIPDCRV